MTRRIKQTGIRHEKNIFFESKKYVRLKVLVFIKLLSGPDRNYTAWLGSPDFALCFSLHERKDTLADASSKEKRIDVLLS